MNEWMSELDSLWCYFFFYFCYFCTFIKVNRFSSFHLPFLVLYARNKKGTDWYTHKTSSLESESRSRPEEVWVKTKTWRESEQFRQCIRFPLEWMKPDFISVTFKHLLHGAYHMWDWTETSRLNPNESCLQTIDNNTVMNRGKTH